MEFDIQKANTLKRVSAFILDFILLCVLAVGFAAFISWVSDFDGHYKTFTTRQQEILSEYVVSVDVTAEQLSAMREQQKAAHTMAINGLANDSIAIANLSAYNTYFECKTQIETKYNVNLSLSADDIAKLPLDQREVYKQAKAELNASAEATASVEGYRAYLKRKEYYEKTYTVNFEISEEAYENLSEDIKAIYNEANAVLSKDEVSAKSYQMVVNLILIMVTFGLLFAYLVLEFIIPLCFKNGMTIGKKIFGIGVMHNNGVRIDAVALFVRTFLGKYTIETMVPAMMILMIFFNILGWIALLVIGLLVVLEVVVFVVSKTKAGIHDILAKTIAIDYASQMIFDNVDELMAYKMEVHNEEADRQDY